MMTVTHGTLAADKACLNRQAAGRTHVGFLRQLAGLLPLAILGCAIWLVPRSAEAAADTYYFQNVASSAVCGGTSTLNQSGEANVLPGGALVSSYGGEVVTNYYHFSWNAGGFNASSLADDMYTAPYSVPMTITGLSLRLNYDVTSGYFANGIYPNTYFYAKFYDVDGNGPCPDYEQGTLIAQTPQQNYPPSTTTTAVSGLSYNIQPGHRIRVELWNSHNFTRVAITFKYGAGTTTGLTVTQTPTLSDTCTVGPGADLPDINLLPGGAETALNAFTLQTSTGTDSIKNVRVSLSQPGSWNVIGSISVKSDNGSITYGTVTNPTKELLTIPLSTAITATTTPVQYRIMVTPKTTAAMPLPPGAAYALQGFVYQLDSSYTKVYNDTTSATLTIDNLSPGTPVLGSISPGDSSVALNWSNPADADFQSVLVLRGTAAITATPAEGSSYTVGSALGASKVVYAGNLQTFTDGLVAGDALWNGTPYYYRIFARDVTGNYSPGVAVGPLTPLQAGAGTATVGNGVDPPSVAAAVSGYFYDLDAFTITSKPYAHLKSVAFTLAPGTATYMGRLLLTNDTGSVTYATLDYPFSDTAPAVFSGLNLTITDIATPFKVRINPHYGNLPPVGSETPVTGRVTGITFDNANIDTTYADNSSATVTLDHRSPANPVVQSVTPNDTSVSLAWTNPSDSDLSNILVLRNTVPVADVPPRGGYYTRGNIIGTSTVVYSVSPNIYGPEIGGYFPFTAYWNGSGYVSYSRTLLNSLLAGATITTDSQLINGTSYYYRIFARDLQGNYSTGIPAGPVMPAVTVTVGNGTAPTNTVISPDSSVSTLDGFTLESSRSTATIDSVTVAFSPGAPDVVGSVRITSRDGLTVYGSVDNPATEIVAIPTTGLVLPRPTPAENNHRVEIIPKRHADMPAVPGAEVAVTGRVTAITTAAASYKVYNDTTSATLTVDNLSPGNPAGGTSDPLENGFSVNWTNPVAADFSGTLVLRSTSPVSDVPAEGVVYSAGDLIGTSAVAYSGNQQSFIEQGLNKAATYYYRFFALDTHGNYSTGSSIGPLQPQPNAKTVAGSVSAVMQGLDIIAVTMPYTDDANGNGSCTVDYKLSSASAWIPWTATVNRSPGRCATAITGLEQGIRYDVRMAYNDSDGVMGAASQTVTGIVALSLLQTTAGDVTAAFVDSANILFRAPFTNDYNRNNSCLIEFKKSSDSSWTYLTSLAAGPYVNGEYSDYIVGLQQMTNYDVRVTFTDPDGVNGSAVQTVTGLLVPSQKNPRLVHNSRNANSKNYWPEYGGWGVPGGMYGEFTCKTCHEKRTGNAAGLKTFIMGKPVLFKGASGPYSFGDDTAEKPDPLGTYRICEVCHTQTYGRIGWVMEGPNWVPVNGPVHRNVLTEPGDHARSNGQDCTDCHKHDNGFAGGPPR